MLFRSSLFLLETSVRQDSKNKVLGNMAALSDDAVPEIKAIRRKRWEKSVEERNDKVRRSICSECIRREEKYDNQPKYKRRPVFNDEALH